MRKPNMGVLIPSMGQANIKPFSNLVNIVRAYSNSLCVIVACRENTHLGGPKGERIFKIIHKSGNNSISRVFRYVLTELKISWCLASLSKNVDLWVFYMGDSSILPMIIAKILRKKVVLAMGGVYGKRDRAI